MSWRGLRKKPSIMPLWLEEWNAVIDSLEDVYTWLFGGTADINVNTINANTGNFSGQVYVDGKPVLKDGDPINLNDIFDPAKAKITEALDSARITSIGEEVRANTASIASTLLEVLDKLNNLLEEYKPVWARGSVTASENTEGLEVVLYKGGRLNLNIYYSLGGAGELVIEGSVDGVVWREVDRYTFAGAGADVIIIAGISYPHVKVKVPTVGIDVAVEVVAGR